MTKKWIIYLILFLLAANIALVASLLIKTGKDDERKIMLKHRKDVERFENKEHRFRDHLAMELKLTDQQKEQLFEFSEEFSEVREQQRKELKRLNQEYFEGLSKNNPDTLKLNHVAIQIGELEVEKIKLEHKHYRAIRSICTPEQTIILDSLSRRQLKIHFIKKDGCGHKRRH